MDKVRTFTELFKSWEFAREELGGALANAGYDYIRHCQILEEFAANELNFFMLDRLRTKND